MWVERDRWCIIPKIIEFFDIEFKDEDFSSVIIWDIVLNAR